MKHTTAIRTPQVAKQPWRTSDGMRHPVTTRPLVVHHVGDPAYYAASVEGGETDPHMWPTEARTVLAEGLRVANPEPQVVKVENPTTVTAAINPDAPAKTRRPGITVPAMVKVDSPDTYLEAHRDAVANVHRG